MSHIPLPAERLLGVRRKIERAKKHIVDLQLEVQTFLNSNPYKVATKHDEHTRKLIYYVAIAPEPPADLSIFVGDAIHNLRSALDHLAMQLVLAGPGPHSDPKQVGFPIGSVAAEYKSVLNGKVQGISKPAKNAIKAIEAYKGGKGHHLWVLQELNNIDKHRLLITAAAAVRSVNLGQYMSAHMRQTFGDKIPAEFPGFDGYFMSSDKSCPLKPGTVLFTGAPDEEVNEKMDFRFDIAFNEPQIIEGESLLPTLQQMTNLVDNIAGSMLPLI